EQNIGECITGFLSLIPCLDNSWNFICPWHGDWCAGLIDNNCTRVGLCYGRNESVLVPVLWEVHRLAVIPFRLPFCIQSNDHNGHICFRCDSGSFGNKVLVWSLCITNAATTIAMRRFGAVWRRNWTSLIC